MTMTLADALALADHASPLPHLAGEALRVLRAELERVHNRSLPTPADWKVAVADYRDCCDTPAYCSSVRRCTAKDAEIETLKAEVAAQRTRADAMAGEAIKHEARADQAAAQQQPAEGEDIMVNTPYDVLTLPLQPSGLSRGPRFVVHVPGPEAVAIVAGEFSEVRQDGEVYWLQTVLLKRPQQLPFGAPLYTAPQQPAAVDGAMPVLIELVATLTATGTVTGGRIYFPERQMRELLKKACDALATQQQGQAVAVELVRDAERYQWLRECAWSHPEAAPACAIFDDDGSILRSIDGSDLDAAIDQARGTASEAKS